MSNDKAIPLYKRMCRRHEVDSIRARLRKEEIPISQLSQVLGVSRTHLSQMFNHRQPMRVLYRYAILAVLLEIKRNRRTIEKFHTPDAQAARLGRSLPVDT